MRKIQAMPLDREAFAPFGEYYDMLHPSGYALAGEITNSIRIGSVSRVEPVWDIRQ